jgi:HD-GYP domain-containing protein (c-di-GMP phosphodiesterase class II)
LQVAVFGWNHRTNNKWPQGPELLDQTTDLAADGCAVPDKDHYATHLAKVNEQKEVVSTQDIVNSRGVLLCRKGTRINADVADRIVQHKLVQPLEEQVQVENCTDGDRLHQRLQALFDKYPDLKQTDHSSRLASDCKDLFVARRLPPILAQKLTVLEERMPHEVDKGVFCAWMSTLVARELGFDRQDIYTTFLAGLVHDMGFLHIDPEILDRGGPLQPPEWRAIQSHVVIGKMVMEKIPGIDHRAARAILEHHERCDGSGYPVGKTERGLDVLGQVIGMCDSIQSIRMNQFERCGRNLCDLLPYLHMNADTYFYTVYKALFAILRNAGLQPTVIDPAADVAAMATQLVSRGKALQQVVTIFTERRVPELAERIGEGTAVFRTANRVLSMTTQSGLVSEQLLEWLQHLSTDADSGALAELNELQLMQNELQWQLGSACRVFRAFLERGSEQSSSEHQALEDIYAEAERCLQALQQ